MKREEICEGDFVTSLDIPSKKKKKISSSIFSPVLLGPDLVTHVNIISLLRSISDIVGFPLSPFAVRA